MGISVESLYIENVSLPQEVEQAIDKRTSVGVMGDKMQSFMQYQTAEAIRDAAKNEGGVAGAGVGLGAGLGMGQMFAEAMKTAKDEPKPTEVAKVACSKCGKMIPADAKFCPECGENVRKEILRKMRQTDACQRQFLSRMRNQSRKLKGC